MKPNFEDLLKSEHAAMFNGIDDNMIDDFEKWLSRLDTEELIAYANIFALQKIIDTIKAK